MEHTQPTQNSNIRSCALVRTKNAFFLFSRHGHGHVRVYVRLRHIKRAMQEPALPSDWPSMAQVPGG